LRLGRFRPAAYPCLKLLQLDGGLYRPALASLRCLECLWQGPFAPWALPHFVAPTGLTARLPTFAELYLAARAATLLLGVSSEGRESFLGSLSMSLHACCHLYPARWMGRAGQFRVPLLPSPNSGWLGTWVSRFRGLSRCSSTLRPACLLTPHDGALSAAF
jgi:hypothetical protein